MGERGSSGMLLSSPEERVLLGGAAGGQGNFSPAREISVAVGRYGGREKGAKTLTRGSEGL